MKVLKNIRLKDIKNNWPRQFYSDIIMRESIYKKDVKQFTGKYTQTKIKLLPFRIERTKYCWEELKDSLTKGYNPEKYKYIIVCNFFGVKFPIDGNHRLALLKKLYADDYTIDVKSISTTRAISTIILVFFLVILFGVLNIVNNLIKIVNNYIVQIFRIEIN